MQKKKDKMMEFLKRSITFDAEFKDEALNDKAIRVATIQPGANRFLQEQAITLASATGATNAAGAATYARLDR